MCIINCLREEPSQNCVILQQKLPAAKLSAVCDYKQFGDLCLQLWLKNHCKNTGYYSTFQLLLLPFLNYYQYNCNNTICSVSVRNFINRICLKCSKMVIHVKKQQNMDSNMTCKFNYLIKIHGQNFTKHKNEYLTECEVKTSTLYRMPKVNKSKVIIDEIKQTEADYVQCYRSPLLESILADHSYIILDLSNTNATEFTSQVTN